MTIKSQEEIYRLAQQRFGYDSQICTLAELAGELSAAACRVINHTAGERELAEKIARTEILIEQLRQNGLDRLVDSFKQRQLATLAEFFKDKNNGK